MAEEIPEIPKTDEKQAGLTALDKRILKIAGWCAIGLGVVGVLFLLAIAANIHSNHDLEAKLITQFSSAKPQIVARGQSPDGNVNYFVMNYSGQGRNFAVMVARKHDAWLWKAVGFYADNHPETKGPLQVPAAVVWSTHNERLAIVMDGWYVASYNMANFKRNWSPVPIYQKSDIQKLQRYHDKVAAFIGPQPLIVECK